MRWCAAWMKPWVTTGNSFEPYNLIRPSRFVGLNFLHPMLYEQGLGKFRTGVIVSRQMNPKSG